jgi:hypothetical protein
LLTETLETEPTTRTEIFISPANDSYETEDLPYARAAKAPQNGKKAEKDRRLLSDENWLKRNGHTVSHLGL